MITKLGRAAAAILFFLPLAPALALTMQCAPVQVVQANTSTYTAAGDGIVTGVLGNDVPGLAEAGCQAVGQAGQTLIGRLIGANMNVTTDQTIPMLIAGNQNYQITAVVARNPSTSLTTAAGGFYTGAAKSGTTLVAAAQVYSAATGSTTVENVTVAAAGLAASLPASTPPILSLTTAQGAAATADIYVYGYVGQ